MRICTLLLSFLLSLTAVFGQAKALVDDSLQMSYRNIGRYSEQLSENYFDLNTFRRYKPIQNQYLPFARSGNNGLAGHSYTIGAQDWNANSLLQGSQPLLFTKDSLRFYTTNRPFTQLSYFNGAESEQQFSIFHTQNLSEGLNLTFNYRRINSEGFYIGQLATHTQFNGSINLKSRDQRFSTDLYYLINGLENQENGGVIISENDVDTDNAITLAVNLSEAQNQSRTQNWGAKSEYNFLNADTTTNPLFSVSHEFNWHKSFRNYSDDLSNSLDFYNTAIFDTLFTNDSSFAQTVSNEIMGNFWGNKFQVGVRNEELSWFQNFLINEEASSNYIVANANFILSGIGFSSSFEKGISGFHENELDWKVNVRFKEMKSLQTSVYSRVSQKQPDFLFGNQRANHNYFSTNLTTSNQLKIGAKVVHEKLKVMIDANYQVLTDFVFLDSLQMPQQNADAISVIQVNFRKNFVFLKNFRLNNNIQFQAISNSDVLPLPAITSLHSLFYTNDFFENSLRFQIGADAAYIGEYNGYAYSPSLSQFHLRGSGEQLGDILQLDLFMNLRIHKSVRVFAKMENILAPSFSNESARIQDYSVPGRVLKFGLSWRMLN